MTGKQTAPTHAAPGLVHALRAATIFALGLALVGIGATHASANATYTYDSLGRLATVVYDSGVTIHYTYDLNGNRLTQVSQTSP